MSLELGRQVPTYDLLNFLKQKYNGVKFYFVVGADVLHTIHTWNYAEKLIRQYPFIVFNRKGYDFLHDKLPLESQIIEADLPEISSSYLKKVIEDK